MTGDDTPDRVPGMHGCWEPLWLVDGIDSGHDPAGGAPFCRALRMVRD